jgi:hypothetical protein
MLNKIALILSLLFVSIFSNAQNLNTSPFTRFGLGELSNNFSSHYLAMGGLSVSLSDYNQINTSNPATYTSLLKNNPIYNVGLAGKYSVYNSNFNNEANNSSGTNIGLDNLLIGLPITKDISVVLGLSTFSTIGYDISNIELLSGDTITYNYNGDGSINKIILGTGYNIINKGDTTKFSVGINSSYLFGNINRNSSVIFQESGFYNSRIQNRTKLNGLHFQAGVHFYQQFKGKSKNDNWYYQFGTSTSFKSNIAATQDFYSYSFIYNYSVQEIPKDTTAFIEDNTGIISLPDKFSIGMSIGRNKQNKNAWTLGLQYNIHNWNIYDEKFENQTSESQNLMQLSEFILGGRITPSLDYSNKTKNILQKSTYMLGAKYASSFIKIDDKQLKNYGINIGMSFPLLSSRSLSLINLGLEFGKLGSLQENLIEENYFKFSLGFSLAPDTRYDRWFKKRKYD